MQIRLFGIDCATQDSKIGVAVGKFANGRLTVQEAFACTREESAAAAITKRLSLGQEPALLAIDAPLGWPQTLARVLANHRAGEALEVEAHDMFRRETDLFIKKKTGKTPLDVGADRIARTAYAALRLLRDIKTNLNLQQIPLAWEWPPTEGLSAIEVYPAATLIGQGFRSKGYKKADQIMQRDEIIEKLRSVAEFSDDVTGKMQASADVLDAVVCLVAAQDFLLGKAMRPENRTLAEVEGWIWTREQHKA
jgi:predicted RNase H-like nuclease